MEKTKSLPFRNLTVDGWRRLGLMAVFVLYLSNALYSLISLGLFNGVGGDFLANWTTGKVADTLGYRLIYDIEAIKAVQFEQLISLNLPLTSFSPIPSPYFSVFLVPFQFLSRLNASTGYWVWTGVTFLILIGYLIFFISRITKQVLSANKMTLGILLLLGSYPVYANLLYGNLELILVISAGEFILAAMAGKEFSAGLWLGLMLVKPQIAVLVVPALLLMKRWRILAGFLLLSAGIWILSTLLTGIDGFLSMLRLWFFYAPGKEIFSPNGMANWRMLATNLNAWTSSSIGWIIAGAGMLATLVLWFRLYRRKFPFGSVQWVLNFGAIFAASLAFTWHSHIHMGMVLIPFLLVLLATNHSSAKRLAIDLWVFSYPAVLLLAYLIALVLMTLFQQPGLINALTGPFLGITGLAIYIIYLVLGLKISQAIDLAAEPNFPPAESIS